MGRGRAKAKQTKVARELKYYSPDTDLRALEAELHGKSHGRTERAPDDEQHVDDDDESWSDVER
ncbi:DUF3073 domain-containing protein [Janibacter sp. DB-40]|uniref:DUF3073 domain-containing protein n=1 Tax=Janibacter sp. DB-40 TaxID=3028808 RepID=UPI0024064D11|nr:DUF3073 domain-containing protein [Janibacter sp. DB-40]